MNGMEMALNKRRDSLFHFLVLVLTESETCDLSVKGQQGEE